jgi:hypothetical protein
MIGREKAPRWMRSPLKDKLQVAHLECGCIDGMTVLRGGWFDKGFAKQMAPD